MRCLNTLFGCCCFVAMWLWAGMGPRGEGMVCWFSCQGRCSVKQQYIPHQRKGTQHTKGGRQQNNTKYTMPFYCAIVAKLQDCSVLASAVNPVCGKKATLLSSFPHFLISSFPHFLISSFPHFLIEGFVCVDDRHIHLLKFLYFLWHMRRHHLWMNFSIFSSKNLNNFLNPKANASRKHLIPSTHTTTGAPQRGH